MIKDNEKEFGDSQWTVYCRFTVCAVGFGHWWPLGGGQEGKDEEFVHCTLCGQLVVISSHWILALA